MIDFLIAAIASPVSRVIFSGGAYMVVRQLIAFEERQGVYLSSQSSGWYLKTLKIIRMILRAFIILAVLALFYALFFMPE